jgi:hypothetical protein
MAVQHPYQDETTRTATATNSASKIMRSLGLAQEGDPLLRQTARPFGLPTASDGFRSQTL